MSGLISRRSVNIFPAWTRLKTKWMVIVVTFVFVQVLPALRRIKHQLYRTILDLWVVRCKQICIRPLSNFGTNALVGLISFLKSIYCVNRVRFHMVLCGKFIIIEWIVWGLIQGLPGLYKISGDLQNIVQILTLPYVILNNYCTSDVLEIWGYIRCPLSLSM